MWGEWQRSFESLPDLDAFLDINLQGLSQSRPNVVFLRLIIIIVFRQRIYFQQSPIVIQIWVGAIARDKIVLAFHPPQVRQYTKFAIA